MYSTNAATRMKAPAGIIFLYIPQRSALKYSFVRIRQRWTGDRRTPRKPAAKANEREARDAPPVILITSGNVLPTNATVIPVRSPVRKGRRQMMGREGMPCSRKN